MMRKFILKLIFFLLPVVIIALLTEFALRNIPNEYAYKNHYLETNASRIQTLILGSSHTFYGLDPVYFSTNTFNAAATAQSLYYDCEILKKYMDELYALQWLVVPVSYFSLYSGSVIGEANSQWRNKNYAIYYHINPSHSLKYASEFLSQNLSINTKRIYRYYIKGISENTCSALGWGTDRTSGKAIDLAETGRKVALQQARDIRSDEMKELYRENVRTLESMIALCNKNKVKVLLLTTPVFETYRQYADQEQLAFTIRTVHEVASKYPDCFYLNFLDDPGFIAEDYYDASHLSETGAKKLSRLVDSVITQKFDYICQ